MASVAVLQVKMTSGHISHYFQGLLHFPGFQFCLISTAEEVAEFFALLTETWPKNTHHTRGVNRSKKNCTSEKFKHDLCFGQTANLDDFWADH